MNFKYMFCKEKPSVRGQSCTGRKNCLVYTRCPIRLWTY